MSWQTDQFSVVFSALPRGDSAAGFVRTRQFVKNNFRAVEGQVTLPTAGLSCFIVDEQLLAF